LSNNITQLLEQVQLGDQQAEQQLVDVVYPKLKQIASKQMSLENSGHTLQATALINEAYMELFKFAKASWGTRNDFFAYAATVMRHILVNHARSKKAQKRGGDLLKVTLHDLPDMNQKEEDLLSLDNALDKLAEMDERKSKIVVLRFFGGLSIEEITQIVSLSVSAVNKELRAARGWIYHEMKA
jgi:RNA polymerase sigma factor (TIGR02999 family)